RTLHRRLSLRGHREHARRAPRLPLLYALLSLMPAAEAGAAMRRIAWIAGLVAAACILVLLADAIIKPRPGDDKRITAARLARRSRDNVVGWVLIGSAGLFLVYAPKSGPRRAGKTDVTPTRRPEAHPHRVVRPEPVDLSFVDDLVEREGRSKEKAIALLQAIQSHYRYLPDEALR